MKENKMEKKNIPFVISILFGFMTFALILDYSTGKNFMFFFSGDGTPFTIFDEHLSFGSKPIYQLWVYVLQCGYIGIFYACYYPLKRSIESHKTNKQERIEQN